MLSFLEARVLLLPPTLGGRPRPVAPRDGNYRPQLRARDGGEPRRIRFIEGPPRLAPGDDSRVVVEVEPSDDPAALIVGEELDIVEGTTIVGFLTVLRVL